jgi:hypothetical protein
MSHAAAMAAEAGTEAGTEVGTEAGAEAGEAGDDDADLLPDPTPAAAPAGLGLGLGLGPDQPAAALLTRSALRRQEDEHLVAPLLSASSAIAAGSKGSPASEASSQRSSPGASHGQSRGPSPTQPRSLAALGFPPVALFHGSHDMSVPSAVSAEMAAVLCRGGGEVRRCHHLPPIPPPPPKVSFLTDAVLCT